MIIPGKNVCKGLTFVCSNQILVLFQMEICLGLTKTLTQSDIQYKTEYVLIVKWRKTVLQ